MTSAESISGGLIKIIADFGGWEITNERAKEIGVVFRPLLDDIRTLQQMQMGNSVPGTFFEVD